jgi:hypothetical protein
VLEDTKILLLMLPQFLSGFLFILFCKVPSIAMLVVTRKAAFHDLVRVCWFDLWRRRLVLHFPFVAGARFSFANGISALGAHLIIVIIVDMSLLLSAI